MNTDSPIDRRGFLRAALAALAAPVLPALLGPARAASLAGPSPPIPGPAACAAVAQWGDLCVRVQAFVERMAEKSDDPDEWRRTFAEDWRAATAPFRHPSMGSTP